MIAANLIGTNSGGTAAIPNGDGDGLDLSGSDNTIGGTASSAANVISGNEYVGIDVGAPNNLIEGNLIGISASGLYAVANEEYGVFISTGATGITVGGTAMGAGNVISGNDIDGLELFGGRSLVEGNKIGTNSAGAAAVGNVSRGVMIESANNTIGGTASGAGNLISGNNIGIEMYQTGGPSDNLAEGNLIGTNASGTGAVPNAYGIELYSSSTSSNTIGGTASGAGNVISGNTNDGIDFNSTGDLVVGNLIGTDITGTLALANHNGVVIESSSSHDTIGGLTAMAGTGAGNVISGNTNDGVKIALNANDNVMLGNLIGTDVTGENALSNASFGVEVIGAGNTIGGTASGSLNVISANPGGNIVLDGSGATDDLVAGNYVGLDLAGATAVGSAQYDVTVESAGNTIGGTSAAARNVISGASSAGVNLDYSGGTGNLIAGNYIGTNDAATAVIANGYFGIWEQNGAQGNTIGGTIAGAGNVVVGTIPGATYAMDLGSNNLIAGNLVDSNPTGTALLGETYGGITIGGSNNTIGGTVAAARNIMPNNGVWLQGNADHNLVEGNISGLDITGTIKLTTAGAGFEVDGSDNTIGGTVAGSANVLAGSASDAFDLVGTNSTGNLVEGNLIGTDITGTVSIRDGGFGVFLESGATNNTIGGTSSAAANVISSNDRGVGIDAESSGNLIEGNKIGTDITGTVSLYNITGILIIGPNNTIGGTANGAGNVISGNVGNPSDLNTGSGVWITGPAATGNVVQGNLIGVDATGENILGNTTNAGIYINSAPGNTIGGSATGAGNVISGNNRGIWITTANDNLVQGNEIGTDLDGTTAVPNQNNGIYILDSASTTIGGASAGTGNLISGNAGPGITIYGSSSTANVVEGNLIGTNAAGTAAIANDGDGVDIENSASGNWVGVNTVGGASETALQGNIISGNTAGGVELAGAGTSGNTVAGNLIGTDPTGAFAIPNYAGVEIDSGASDNLIGTNGDGDDDALEGNLISGNSLVGVWITDAGTDSNVVAGDYVGTDVTGMSAIPNGTAPVGTNGKTDLTGVGVAIEAGASDNRVGTNGTDVDPAGERNIISGNDNDGVEIGGAGSSGNLVAGNYLGLAVTGTAAVANQDAGVFLDTGASGNTIGGITAALRNVIGGNDNRGIYIYTQAYSSTPTTGNVVEGNYIGTDASGMVPMSNNANDAVSIDTSPGNTIGGTVAGAGNVLDAGDETGIFIYGDSARGPYAAAADNLIAGNIIGLAADGVTAAGFGNGYDGIVIDSAPGTTIGGSVAAARNIISNNTSNDGAGILLANFEESDGASSEVVQGNFIGTDITGTLARGNDIGIDIEGVSTALIGTDGQDGAADGLEGNLISGNLAEGIRINAASANVGGYTTIPGAVDNVVAGNRIGTNAAGTAALANGSDGVQLEGGTTSNWIGVNAVYGPENADQGNLISGNIASGIQITDAGLGAATVAGNYIGTDITGTSAVPNYAGVEIDSGEGHNLIGTNGDGVDDALERNVISGNLFAGVWMTGAGTDRNTVAGNDIGTDATGENALGNGSVLDNGEDGGGIVIEGGASNNLIGTSGASSDDAGERNIISGNFANGVDIYDSGTSNNVVAGNSIGTDATGTAVLGNGIDGVMIAQAALNNWIGVNSVYGAENADQGNVISGNGNDGVEINGAGTAGNVVAGNQVGMNDAGSEAIANLESGVEIDCGATSNTIGGTTTDEGNLISGNAGEGVLITDSGTTGNVVEGNLIGTDSTGTTAFDGNGNPLGNFDGVEIESGATDNTIGGTTTGSGDVISGNTFDGVEIAGSGTSGNVVEGDFIGTDFTGTTALDGNGKSLGNFDGVEIASPASNNTVGGTTSGASNVLSGNKSAGVLLEGTDNVVEGNLIGTDVTGSVAIGNSEGVAFNSGASGNTIGGLTTTPGSGAGNVISGNDGTGITDYGGSNVIAGNLIGTSASGTASLANLSDGMDVYVGGGTIGGTAGGAGNVISGNDGYGIYDDGSNLIAGNLIGTDPSGTTAVPNDYPGIYIQAAGSTIGGTTAGAANVISGNHGGGITVIASANLIEGNEVGTTSDGTAALANIGDGIDVDSSGNTIGGTAAGAGNVIAFNSGPGVVVGSSATDSITGDSVLTNEIYSNTGLGIDLGDDGVTLNDSSGHTGPNLFQDFPVITSTVSTNSTTTVSGTITETPNTTYLLQFFSDPALSPSGYGQGQTYLTSTSVMTGSDGTANFSIPISSVVPGGEVVSATATDPAGNTSEFSADSIAVQSVSWVNPSGGDWDTPSNWSTDAVPGAGDDVTISIAVSGPITHDASTADSVNSLISTDPITLGAGSLAIGITAQLSASLTLAGGTIDGGTIELSGGAALIATNQGGTLAGVTLGGTLDMTGYYATLDVIGGLTLDNGTIDIGDPVAADNLWGTLIFQGAQTLAGSGSIVFGGSGNNQIYTETSGGDSGTLTIGPNIAIQGDEGLVGYDIGGTQTPLVLEGTIDANTSAGGIAVGGTNWTNAGMIEATDGGSVYLYGTNWINSGTIEVTGSGAAFLRGANWTNSGTIEATHGASAYLFDTWADDGVISADSSSVIYLEGTFSVDSGASFAGAGNIDLLGTLDNTGGTLTLDVPGLTFALDGGTIEGGSVEPTNGAALFASPDGGTLDGVILDGTLDLNAYPDSVTITDGLTLNGAIDLGPTGSSNGWSFLNFQGAQTLSGTGSIVFGNYSGNEINTASSGGDSGTLTIGPNITIQGYNGTIGGNNGGTQTPLVLEGTINSNSSGGIIAVYGTNWINSGTIEATAASAVFLRGTNWTNSGTIEATHGGSAYVFDTWTDDGVISADSSSVIYLEGTFSVDSGASFAGAGNIDLLGTLDNTGGTLTLDDSALTFALYGGTIDGGIVQTTSVTALFATDNNGTLDGVTIDGTLDLNAYQDTVTVTDGLTLNGTINLGPVSSPGGWATLNFQGRSDPFRHRLDRLRRLPRQPDQHRQQ